MIKTRDAPALSTASATALPIGIPYVTRSSRVNVTSPVFMIVILVCREDKGQLL